MLELRGMMPDDAAATPRASLSGDGPLFTATPELPPEDKLLTLKMAIKMADLGNLSKGHDYTMAWTDRVLDEFFSQARRVHAVTRCSTQLHAVATVYYMPLHVVTYRHMPSHPVTSRLMP